MSFGSVKGPKTGLTDEIYGSINPRKRNSIFVIDSYLEE